MEDCMETRKSAKVPQAATLKQILMKKCSSFGRKQRCDEGGYRVKAPKGHFVVYVGENRSRYIIPISYLAHPDFKLLLQMAADEYGFSHDTGLTIPCDESFFQSLVSVIR